MHDFLRRPTSRNAALRELLSSPPLLMPGAHDALTARLVEQAGFGALYVGGYAATGAQIGRPDMGLLTGTEMIAHAQRIASAVNIPVVADADTGYGNAINVVRTVHEYEQAGVSAIHLEDQVAPKRCGHMAGKSVVPAGEHVGKIKAAVAARSDPDFVVIARTDALAVEGVDEACERALRYRDAGADVLWVEAPTTEAELATICERLSGNIVLLNWLEGGQTPMIDIDEINRYGFGVVVFPIGSVLAVTTSMREYYASVREHGTPLAKLDDLVSFDDFTKAVGISEIAQLSREFADLDED